MAETEPTKLPEWVSDDPPDGPQDPDSLRYAIEEPSSAKKGTGFLRLERPPRQDFNWLLNLIWLWIKWFQQQVNAIFDNLSLVITTSTLSEDMVSSSSNLTEALNIRYSFYKIDGFEIVNWTNAVETGDLTATLTYNNGKCIKKGGGFTFDSENQSSMAGFTKKFQKTYTTYVKGSGNAGVAVPGGLSDTTWYFIFLVYFDDDTIDIAMDDNVLGTNVQTLSGFQHLRRLSAHYFDNTSVGFASPCIQKGDIFTNFNRAGTSQWNINIGNQTEQAPTTGLTCPNVDMHITVDILAVLTSTYYTMLSDPVPVIFGTLPSSSFYQFAGSAVGDEKTRRMTFYVPAANQYIEAKNSVVVAGTAQVHKIGLVSYEDNRSPF